MKSSAETPKRDVAVIGGGPAGLAAAIAVKEAGCDVLIIERDRMLGGILNQCIHDGFGLRRFNEALSGPEYAWRFIERVAELEIPVMLNTIVLSMSSDRRLLLSRMGEMAEIEAKAVILTMGCRERTRGALSIPGHRPSGVYTAGAAQKFVNIENMMPGHRICIVGSGDIGLIMARRMILEGAEVEGVFEILPWSSGLPRNIRQCLADYGIPLFLNTTVVDITGMRRLEGVRVAEVDKDRHPIDGTERFVPCDTLLLSVGLIPENELAREAGIALNPVTGGPFVDENCMTGAPGIFSCGNALHVHDLVDNVSDEAERSGRSAVAYITGRAKPCRPTISVIPSEGVSYVIPDHITLPETSSGSGSVSLAFRVTSPKRDGVTRLISGGSVLKEERHSRLHPAVMMWMNLSKAEIEKLREKGQPLEVTAS